MWGVFPTKLSIRTVDEIQRHIIERGERNAISRRYHVKEDKEAIATWKLDLDRTLRVFNVCSVTPARRSLTFHFQTEPGVDAHPTASDTHQDATNKPTIGSGVENAHTIISDIRRNKLKDREGADGRNQAVSTVLCL